MGSSVTKGANLQHTKDVPNSTRELKDELTVSHDDDTASESSHEDQAEDEDETASEVSDSDSTSEYVTASDESDESDDEEEQSEEARRAEREARELERQRVLEAAGFIFKSDKKPPPRPARARFSRKRRPPPAVPEHTSDSSPQKDLPSLPEQEQADNAFRLDDAYERYEAYKKMRANTNRLSLASLESSPSITSPSITSPTVSSVAPNTPVVESDSRHSGFLSFFRSKTPNETETRTMPVISAPILIKKESSNNEEDNEDAFGSVRVTIDAIELHALLIVNIISLGPVWSTNLLLREFHRRNVNVKRYVTMSFTKHFRLVIDAV